MGAVNICVLWPLFLILHYTGIEEFSWPPRQTLGKLTATGLVNITSDYLWARSILLTSPLLATIGLSLTIPLALVVDEIIRGVRHSTVYFVGSAFVAVGFLLVNYEATQKLEDDEPSATASVSA